MNIQPKHHPVFPGFEVPRPASGIQAVAPTTRQAPLKPADILVVLAHPDDETFLSGTTALLKDRGYSVQFVYATDGDAGWDHTGSGLWGRDLGNHRRTELRQALKHLGLDREPVFLDIPDGQVPSHEAILKEKLKPILRQTQPKLVLTFGPDGLTRHRDHISVGKITDELAKSTDVYHIAMTSRALKRFMDPHAFGNSHYAAWQDLITIPPKKLSVRVDIREKIPQKMAAIESHRCQFVTEVEAFRAYCGLYPYEEFAKA